MKTRIFLALIFLVLTCVTVSAEAQAWSSTPGNTISVDIGTPIASLLTMGMTRSGFDFRSYFIASAIQYERQLLPEFWSVAGRVGYTGYFEPGDDFLMSSLSVEGHCRYYPGGRIFFLDGMLGYANFAMQDAEWVTSMSHHFLLGGKFGWRFDFGSPGGLILDFSMGYYGAFGKTNLNFDTGLGVLDFFLAEWLELAVKNIFIAGPRMNFHIGYRF